MPTMNARARSVKTLSAVVNKWVTHVGLMKTATCPWLAKLQVHGHLYRHAKDWVFRMIPAQLITIAILKPFVGTSTAQTFRLA